MTFPLVTELAAFHYLFYCAYRKVKPRNSRKFNLIHDVLLTQEQLEPYESLLAFRIANPGWRCIGESQYGKIHAALRDLANTQYTDGAVNITAIVGSTRIRQIAQMIRDSKPAIDQATFKERRCLTVEAFGIVDRISDIEQEMWQRSTASTTLKRIMVGLRNRFFFNGTVQEIKCREALWKGRLWDMVFVGFKKSTEPSQYQIITYMISDGKTVKGSDLQLAKLMGHKLPEHCSQGAAALYLFVGFKLTREDEIFDLTNNSSWLKAALHVSADATIDTNSESVGISAFSDAIGEVFAQIRLPSDLHKGHFGRTSGPAVLEIGEVSTDQTKQLGNWDPDVYQRVCSIKLPLEAMPVAAGFAKTEGTHYNPRAEFSCPTKKKSSSSSSPTLSNRKPLLIASTIPQPSTSSGFCVTSVA